jgi:hypothetical protein
LVGSAATAEVATTRQEQKAANNSRVRFHMLEKSRW